MLRFLLLPAVAVFLSAAPAFAQPVALVVAHAEVIADEMTGDPVLDIRLAPDSTKSFADFTAANIGRTVALKIDGALVASPVVREPIVDGTVRITGGFKPGELRAIAAKLSSASARIEVEVVD